jgi:adenylate kinase family enzyme
MSKKIAIIGTRGAGKTVFITALAKYLSKPRNGIFLNPESYEVAEYVELNWAILNRSEWIPSTNIEQILNWKFYTPGNISQLRLLDYNGEDFHRLFTKKEFLNTTSSKDQELLDYLHDSQIILLLINLQDFLDESLEEDRVKLKLQRQIALKEFLTEIRKDKKRDIAIVFTAYNQYQETIEKRYGSRNEFFQQELPFIYYEHFAEEQVLGFPVSAVAQTVINEENNRVPAQGFTSEGLDNLLKWIVNPEKFIQAYFNRKQENNNV